MKNEQMTASEATKQLVDVYYSIYNKCLEKSRTKKEAETIAHYIFETAILPIVLPKNERSEQSRPDISDILARYLQ